MKNLKGVLYALISSGTFGLIPLFSVPLLQAGQLNMPSILFYRFLFSSIIIGAICLIKKESFKLELNLAPSLIGLSLLYAATALFLIFSYTMIPTGVATTIHFLYPIFVSFLMVAFFHEKKSIALFFAAILSLVGVALLCWSGTAALNIKGILIVSITIVTYGLYIVGINMSKANKVNAEILTFYILFLGAVIFFIFALCTTGVQAIPDLKSFLYLLLLAIFPTVVSDFTLILAIKYAGSTITSILGSMEPLVAVTIGIFCFSEGFNLSTFFGALLIIFSVILVILFNKQKA